MGFINGQFPSLFVDCVRLLLSLFTDLFCSFQILFMFILAFDDWTRDEL
jgi:hypothetical protein